VQTIGSSAAEPHLPFVLSENPCMPELRPTMRTTAHQHHPRQAEALLELVDLRGERHRVGGVAGDTSTASGQPSAAHNRP